MANSSDILVNKFLNVIICLLTNLIVYDIIVLELIKRGRQALKATKTIGAVYVERKGESVIGRNPQQMRVIEVEGSDTLADCTPPRNY